MDLFETIKAALSDQGAPDAEQLPSEQAAASEAVAGSLAAEDRAPADGTGVDPDVD